MLNAARLAREGFSRAFGYVRSDWMLFVLAVVAGSVPSIVAANTISGRDANAADVVTNLFTLYLQLLITFRALRHAGAAPAGYRGQDLTQGRFVSAFVANLLESIGVAVGAVALVVPGLVLLVLWSVSLPALAAENLPASQALMRSWRLVRPAFGDVALVMLAFVLTGALAFAPLIVPSTMAVPTANVASGASTVALTALMMLSPAVWVSVYVALTRGVDEPVSTDLS